LPKLGKKHIALVQTIATGDSALMQQVLAL